MFLSNSLKNPEIKKLYAKKSKEVDNEVVYRKEEKGMRKECKIFTIKGQNNREKPKELFSEQVIPTKLSLGKTRELLKSKTAKWEATYAKIHC